MNIEEIIRTGERPAEEIIADLKKKTISVPAWGQNANGGGLASEYNPLLHPVMDKSWYPDVVAEDGRLEPVTRITYDLQRLAVKRMTELCNGIPVKRIYSPGNDRQKDAAAYLEAIFRNNRIDAVNIERCNMLFAGCEVMTLWYAVEQKTNIYGFDSSVKIRCANYSPMQGDELYPLFDEYGDMIAMSVAYTRKVTDKDINYFDAYTADHHYKWSNEDGWALLEEETYAIGKIPCVYMFRPTPIWEQTSSIVYEMEWAMSRNGNYLRKNSKPLFVVYADQEIPYGREGNQNSEYKAILQYPAGSTAQYVTWPQAIESLKYHMDSLRSLFFTTLQLPDWNYERMSQMALSGESRKQLFIDAMMKVNDESGRLIEFYSREVNVVKQFLVRMLGEGWRSDVESLPVEIEITPYTITDEKDTISNLYLANGGKPLVSHRESIELAGLSSDTDRTLEEIQQDQMRDAFEPTE
jgi:hypothetical protein